MDSRGLRTGGARTMVCGSAVGFPGGSKPICPELWETSCKMWLQKTLLL